MPLSFLVEQSERWEYNLDVLNIEMFPLAKYHEFDPIFYILEFKDVFFLLNGVIYEHIFLLAKRSTKKVK